MMRMFSKLFRKRIDNKGNTLGILMIGIIIIAILGTLILSITAANYDMKLSEMKSKKSFYYVEKAVDEIYAGLGTDVLAAMKESYTEVLDSMIKKNVTTGTYESVTNEVANQTFRDNYLNKLKKTYDNTGATQIQDVLNKLQSYIETVNGVDLWIKQLPETKIVYENNTIKLMNINVNSKNRQGFLASVTTDFVMKVPKVMVNFTDSSERDIGPLLEYCLVADGNQDKQETPAISVKQNYFAAGNRYFKTKLYGNVYAGSTANDRKDSVMCEPNSQLEVFSKNFINKGSLVLDNSSVTMTGEDSSDTGSLQLWAKNLSTIGNREDRLEINGKCAIADDLEVNGTNSKISINGSYYGYGYQQGATRAEEANSTESNKMTWTEDTFEHENRSAIVVNGKGADVDLSGVSNLILGGRAYIDLADGSSYGATGTATYMTGESISFKGNQKVYLADLGELTGTTGVIASNPTPYSTLTGYLTTDDVNYAALGISGVVAKKVGNSVYFYHRENNPVAQNQYFLDKFAGSMAVRNEIKEQVAKLDVKNLKLNSRAKMYTSGAVTEVENGNLKVPGDYFLKSGENGISKNKFLNLVDDMSLRYKFISSELRDFREDVLGEDIVNTSVTPSTKTPFEYFVSKSGMADIKAEKGVRYERQNIENDVRGTAEEELYAELGIDVYTDKVGVIIMDNKREPQADGTVPADEECYNFGDLHYGIIIATGDVTIYGDFMGLVLCGGDLTLQPTGGEDQVIRSSKELVALIADNDPYVQKALDYVAGSVTGDSASSITMDDITYKDLIDMENWRKNS